MSVAAPVIPDAYLGRRSARRVIGTSLLAVLGLLIGLYAAAFFIVNATVVGEYLTTPATAPPDGNVAANASPSPDAGNAARTASATPGTDHLAQPTILTIARNDAPRLPGLLHLDPNREPGQTIAAVEKHFRPISVDYSAATPFKIAWFFALLGIASVRSLLGRIPMQDLRDRSQGLPFFPSLETTFVQLGLAGTIWGFLLIGWRLKNDPDLLGNTSAGLQILLDAFGTALISTFTGVVLAYIFAPLLRQLWNWLHGLRRARDGIGSSVAALAVAMRDTIDPTDKLRSALLDTHDPATKLTLELRDSCALLERLRIEFEERAKKGGLFTHVDELIKAVQSLAEATSGAAPPVGALRQEARALADRLRGLARDNRQVRSAIQSSFQSVLKEISRVANLLETDKVSQVVASAITPMVESTRFANGELTKLEKTLGSNLKAQAETNELLRQVVQELVAVRQTMHVPVGSYDRHWKLPVPAVADRRSWWRFGRSGS